jgi:Tfp pilus assembly protein PilF
MSNILNNLIAMLGTERENSLLHHSIGNEYFKLKDFVQAENHFRRALSLDPQYSAAWKLLGKTLAAANKNTEAVEAYKQGISIAEKKGDIQAGKEMKVFMKRLTNLALNE